MDRKNPTGKGPGTITRDGCAVDLYTVLPENGEAELIQTLFAPPATILDLGCGTGRITHPLLKLGYSVVAVDNSAEMLDHVIGAEKINANIEDLVLGRTFDVVLIASNLINNPNLSKRRAVLDCAKRHAKSKGFVAIQCHNLPWFDELVVGVPRRSRLGEVDVTLLPLDYDDRILHAVVNYDWSGLHWEQDFSTQRLEEIEIRNTLAQSDLEFQKWLNKEKTWLVAKLK